MARGALTTVGQRVPRVDGLMRARGEALYTADLQLPGMLHTAVLRSPYARARVTPSTSRRARSAPACGRDRPGRPRPAHRRAWLRGPPIAAVAADTFGQAQAAVERIAIEWDVLEPLLDPDEAVRQESFVSDVPGTSAATSSAGSPRQTWSSKPSTGRRSCCTTRWRRIRPSATGRTTGSTSTSRRSTSGASAPRWPSTRPAARQGARHLSRDGRRLRSEEQSRRLHADCGRAREEHRSAGKCALTRREENVAAGNRNATIQRLSAGATSDGTLVALGGDFVNAVGFSGWSATDRGADEDALRVRERAHDPVPGTSSTCRRWRRFALPASSRARSRSSASSTSSQRSSASTRSSSGVATTPTPTAPTTVLSRRRTSRSVIAARSRTGRSATRFVRAARGRGSTASVSRRRSGTAAAARPRTRGSASAPTAAPRSSPRCRTSAPARAPRWHRSRRRSSGFPSSTCRSRSATRRAGRSHRSPQARRPCRRWDRQCARPPATPSARSSRSPRSGSTSKSACSTFETARSCPRTAAPGRSTEVTGLLESGQILGKGARGPNPAGMQVLTFGVQVAEIAVDVETGEVRVDKIVAIHDVGRVINALGAESQVEGGIIQGIGHTLSEERIVDPSTGSILTRTLDAYRMPTIADVPGDRHGPRRRAGSAPDEPRLEGPRRAADHPGRRRDRERHSRCDRSGVRSLPITREEMLRALREARGTREGAPWSYCGRLAPRKRPRALGNGSPRSPAGRSSCRCCATASSSRQARPHQRRRPAGRSTGHAIGAGTTLAELEADPQIPQALREACAHAASPQLRSMGTIGGNLLQATRCWYWRLGFDCWLHGGERALPRTARIASTPSSATSCAHRLIPSDVAAALLALGATLRTTKRELSLAELYRLPTDEDRSITTLAPDELILELDVPGAGRVDLPQGDGPPKWAFPLVGVAAARFDGEVRIALAGVAPIPWTLDSTRRPRRGHAASRHGLQGRDRSRSRPTSH